MISKSATQLSARHVTLGSIVDVFHGTGLTWLVGCMPPTKVPISRDIENPIQEACTQLRTQAKPKISNVIRELEIEAHTGVALPYHTVCNRFTL